MDVAPGTVVIWSDLACPWAHRTVYHLHEARARLGVEDRVRFDHRAFPLELFNERPSPKPSFDTSVPVVAGIAPDAGWQPWQGEPSLFPNSTVLGMEAVQAAKEQGLEASEQLDRALRLALFAESRCITMRHEVLAAAERCPAVDVAALAEVLDSGRCRRVVVEHWRTAPDLGVKGSPHVFLPDGTDAHNPGVQMHRFGEQGKTFLVVDHNDPSVFDGLIRSAADTA